MCMQFWLKYFEKLKNDILIFPLDTRKFITSNFFFGLFNPFYIIFSNTFIFQVTSGDLSKNLIYCIFTYIGIMLGFILTGKIATQFSFRNLQIIGIWVMFFTILFLFFIKPNQINDIILLIIGLSTGMGSGIYWASRNFLTLKLTSNENRDFFSGIDYILISAGRIITPFIIGIFIGVGIKNGWFSASVAYLSILIPALVFATFATIFSLRVKNHFFLQNELQWIKQPTLVWQDIRKLFFFLGFYQGTFFVVPTVFIMKFLGSESLVGSLNALCYMLSILIIYAVSSRSSIEHRTIITKIGFYLFLAGTFSFAAFLPSFPELGTYILVFMMFFTESILNFPARATMLTVIDSDKNIYGSDGYQHLVDIELFSEFGRIAGLILFYLLYRILPDKISLPLYVNVIALFQWQTVKMSKKINGR